MKTVITISREFGSGGHAIGKALAQKLGIPFYDKELLGVAAKRSGICEDLFVKHDESYSGSLLYSLVMGTYTPSSDGRLTSGEMPLNHKIFLAQFEAIKTLAQEPCVIVGRCADYVLRDNPNVVNFFVTGNIIEKKKRILERYDIEKNKVEDFIRKTDKRRKLLPQRNSYVYAYHYIHIPEMHPHRNCKYHLETITVPKIHIIP